MADNSFKIVARLDIPASVGAIINDIPKLEKTLRANKEGNVKIVAGLDTNKSAKFIQSQLNALTNQANAPTIKVGIDTGSVKTAISNITNQSDTSQSLKIFNSKQLEAEGRKYFTKTTDILDRVKRYYQQNGALKVDITSLETAKGQIQSFTAVVEDSNNVIKHFNYERAKIDTGGKKANYGFAQTDSLKTVDKNAGANLKTTLNFLSKIDEKIMSIQSKATKQSNPLQEGTVYYENYNNKLTETVAKIEEIKNAHTTLSTKQKNEINKMITELDLYRKEQQKLAYPPMISSTSIDDSVKTAQASLTTLEQKWKNQGILTGEFKTQVIALKAELDKVGDTESLKKYNVSLKLAQEQAKQLYQIKRDDTTTEDKLRLEFMQKLTKSYTQLISLKNQFAKSTNADNKSVYQTEIAQTEEIIRNLTEQFQTSGLITQIYQEQINQLKHQVVLTDEINKNTAQANATKQSQQAFKNYYNDIQKTTKAVETAISSLNQLNNSTVFRNNSSNPQVTQTKQELVSLRTEYQQLLTQLQANPTSQGLETLRTKLTELDNRMKTAVNSAKAFQDQLKSDNSADQLRKKVELLTRQMKAYQATNTKAAKAYKQQFSDMFAILSNPNIDNQAFTTVQKQFQALRQEAIATGKVGKTMFQTIGDAVKKFAGWMSMTYLVSSFARSLREMVNNVIELDSAMTNLKKVTDETEVTYSKFLKSVSKQAKELHSTMTDLIEQTSEWAKLGYDLNQANQLSKASMIYANVGEVDNEQAVTNIVSAMKAFDIAVDDVMSIPDVYNKLGNEFAISSANLGSSMSQAATTMAMAGNDFNQVAAILTGAGEILGDNKLDEIGNGMKTVTLRIQNQAGALKELGEEYEDLISVSKTQQQVYELTGGAVNIMSESDPNTFRSTYDILKDVANVIDDMNDTEASELIQLLFGKNRANVGTAVLKAFQSGQIEKAYKSALNSAGSAQKEFDAWSESIEAHINTFKASWESLSQTIVDSKSIKSIVDLGTTILNTLDSIIEKFGTIPTLLGGITAVGAFKNVGGLYLNTPPYAPLQLCA